MFPASSLCEPHQRRFDRHKDAHAQIGTTFPATTVTLPPEQLAADFTEKIHPLVERIIANIHESRMLAALRDALLPKLLSGELRVPAASGSMEART